MVDRIEFAAADDAGFDHALGEHLDAVLVDADVLKLALGAVGLLVALEVAEHADHLALEKGGATALAGPLDDFSRRFIHGEEVEAIDRHAREGRSLRRGRRRNRPPRHSRARSNSA